MQAEDIFPLNILFFSYLVTKKESRCQQCFQTKIELKLKEIRKNMLFV